MRFLKLLADRPCFCLVETRDLIVGQTISDIKFIGKEVNVSSLNALYKKW